jgi:LCP family protein required for cell wall assembly
MDMKKKKKIIIISISVILILILGVCAYGYILLGHINSKKLSGSDDDLGITPVPQHQDSGVKVSITNIAFFGLDRRNPDVASRSDSIMVVSLDNKNEKVKVSSLMRDMYVPIPGKEDTRINAAYAYGGAQLAIKTINSNFGLDIRNYVTVDFFGLEKLIDKVGGVSIDVKQNEVALLNSGVTEVSRIDGDKNPPYISKSGLQTLNGRQAVAYSRIRYVGNSDYERTERQRRVINELFKKIKSKGILQLPGIITTILPYVETSLSKTEIMELAMEAMKFNTDSIEQFRLPVDGHFKSQKIKGMDVLVPNMEENKNLLHEFIYGKGE